MPSNMSRGCYKVNRKPAHSSLQFADLFDENSSRPSAAKSAGTVGRWGVISCTSLRSTNLNGRRDDNYASKKMRMEFSGKNSQVSASLKDPFSFDNEKCGPNTPPPVVKPKKFFKSRNVEGPAAEELSHNTASYMGSNRSCDTSYKNKTGRKYGKNCFSSPPSVGSKKYYSSGKISSPELSLDSDNEQTEAMNLSSPTKTAVPAREENKPPIVLRIIKGTSHLVNDLGSPPSARHHENSGVIVRSSSRKRSHSTDQDYRPYNSSILNIPKKSTRELRSKRVSDSSVDYKPDEPSKEVDSKPEKGKSGSTIDAIKEEVEQRSELEDSDNSSKQSESPELNNTNTTSLCKPETNTNSDCASEMTSVNNTVIPSLNEGEEEIQEKENFGELQKEESLDNYTSEKLPQKVVDSHPPEPPVPTPPAPITTPSLSSNITNTKTFLDQDWFSDSDCSDSFSDQINTIASNEGEADMETEVHPNAIEACEMDEKCESEPEPEMKDVSSEKTSPPSPKIESRPIVPRISPIKKGSIFKCRSQVSGSKKRLALYKHKWAADDKEGNAGDAANATGRPTSVTTVNSQPCLIDEDFEPSKLTRVTSWPLSKSEMLEDEQEMITSVKCPKTAKEYYTVVRNVKKAHQIQESGEFQEFNDDVEYILDTLQDNNPIGTRCLSAISLASKCMAPAFRMHVRAHGTVAKFFRALHDATKDQSLGLCTATVMFVLSQDRLNMDLDRDSLELMLNLLECDASHNNALDDCGMSSAQLHRNKQKVRELCADIQSQGHAKYLNLDNITVGHLAMETLLSLTSRRAGEWFKEELRELGGLEHIVQTICDCCSQIDDYVVEWTEPLLDKLRKVDRCLRVLENVTHQNEENQLYLLKCSGGILVNTLVKLYCQCDVEIPLYPVLDTTDKDSAGAVIREALLATLKVLINLSHDFNDQSYGSTLLGERPGVMDASMHIMLQVPNYVPEDKRFEFLVLSLLLLVNLVEHNVTNRKLLFEARAPADPENVFQVNKRSAVEALIALFYEQEERARDEEGKTDAILDGKKDEAQDANTSAPKSQEEFIEETVAKLLQKAGRNMEHTLIGSYAGLVLGYLVMGNKEYEVQVRRHLPDGSFKTMIAVLQKVYNFMTLTASAVGSSRGIAQIQHVINCLMKSDAIETAVQNAMSHNFTLDDSVS